jgi:hypothetical protein
MGSECIGCWNVYARALGQITASLRLLFALYPSNSALPDICARWEGLHDCIRALVVDIVYEQRGSNR